MSVLDTYNDRQIAALLIDDARLCGQAVTLKINDFVISLRSNSQALLDWCQYYFAHVVNDSETTETHIEILAIERQPVDLDINFQDWIRVDKQKARKDAIYDLAGARVLKKVRTGMLFLQSQSYHIAAGECLKNKNQVINFINAQYMSHLQNHHAVICHAAGIVYNNQALGMAGFSGGGKSTLMLHMLSQAQSRFLSNDRLFIKKNNTKTLAIGIPKLPRVNPGTIIHNSSLVNMINPQRREQLLQLPQNELWNLEEKYDVIIDECYGPDRIQYQAPINNFLVLNWQHHNHNPVELKQVNLNERPDLLAALMKSPGPFYQFDNGKLFQQLTPLNEQHYLNAFADIHVHEAIGKVDFQTLSQLCYQQLLQ